MDYTIQEVMVGQIVVRFEDDTIAVVGGIGSDTTPEVIDHYVSYHDPEHATPVELIVNELVSVGEQRTSNPIDGWAEAQQSDLQSQSEEIPDPESTSPYTNGVPQIADYLARRGDTRLQEALDNYLRKTFTTEGVDEIDPQQWIDFLERNLAFQERMIVEQQQDADEIWNQALEELENE